MSDRVIDKPTIIGLVKQECDKRELDYKTICAIIETESRFDTYAMRYEPLSMLSTAVEESARLSRISVETEKMAQKFSFGLGQVLGATCRWLGFRDVLTCLCDPKIGIYWCCEAFEKLGDKYLNLDEKIAAYNAGSVKRRDNGNFANQGYVDQVLTSLRTRDY